MFFFYFPQFSPVNVHKVDTLTKEVTEAQRGIKVKLSHLAKVWASMGGRARHTC